MPFPAHQKSLGHLSLSIQASFLGGVVGLVHGYTEKYITELKIRIKVNTRFKCYKAADIKILFLTYINSVLSHPGRTSRTLKSEILPLTNLIVLGHVQRPTEC